MLNKKTSVPRKLSVGRVGLALGLSAIAAIPGMAVVANSHAAAQASYQLSYNTNELKSVGSVNALHLRIRRAARDYCPNYAVTKNLHERASCIKNVEADLVSQVDHPLLSRVHWGDAALAIASTSR